MRFIRSSLILLAAISLAGCETFNAATSTVDMKDPSKAAYAAQAAYVGLLPFATQYARQPRCTAPNAPPAPLCSDRAVLDTMRKLSDSTDKATQGAVDAVRSFGSNPTLVRVAIEGAQKSVNVFQQVVEAYKGAK
jgi:hypothetical protein